MRKTAIPLQVGNGDDAELAEQGKSIEKHMIGGTCQQLGEVWIVERGKGRSAESTAILAAFK